MFLITTFHYKTACNPSSTDVFHRPFFESLLDGYGQMDIKEGSGQLVEVHKCSLCKEQKDCGATVCLCHVWGEALSYSSCPSSSPPSSSVFCCLFFHPLILYMKRRTYCAIIHFLRMRKRETSGFQYWRKTKWKEEPSRLKFPNERWSLPLPRGRENGASLRSLDSYLFSLFLFRPLLSVCFISQTIEGIFLLSCSL